MDISPDFDRYGYNSDIAEVYYSTGNHMPSHASARLPTPRLDDLLAYADNFLYRDPTPSLPNPLPLPHQLDARILRPATVPELSEAVIEGHKKTGAPGLDALLRVPVYINPGRDVAFASAKFYDLLSADGKRRNVRNVLSPSFFWELGNPPLARPRASELLQKALLEANLVDVLGIPHELITEEQLQLLVNADAAISSGVGKDFCRYAAIALNVVYDVENFGRMQAWIKLYNFHVEETLPLRDKFWQVGRMSKTVAAQKFGSRQIALSRTFEQVLARYREDLATEAVEAAAAE